VAKDITALQRKRGENSRSVEEAVSYAVGHRIRIEILAALHEGPASAKELARIVHLPLSNISHHVEELHAAGSIDIARTEQVGNIRQNFYCVVQLPYYSDEDIAAMTGDERQVLAGIILQAVAAEALASLWAGKLRGDPRVMLAWNRVTLDEQGRSDLADEQARSWIRMMEIEVESTNRRVESRERGTTYVIASLGFERSRTAAPEKSVWTLAFLSETLN
jgi:DNA-binding transcriptional ArsR family regulator